MKTIYFDEAGNTGQDLLNKDQNVFVLASVHFSEKELRTIQEIFKSTNEIHFKNLKETQFGRDKILEFINHDLISEENIIYSICNKKYVVIAQIVDLLIETVYHESGIDIYQFGVNLYYTNSIYFFGNNFWTKNLFDVFLESFVNMIRKKDVTSIQHFYQSAYTLHNSGNEDYYDLLLPVLESRHHIDSILKCITKYSLDVTLSTFMVLSDKWYKKLHEKFNVHFDNSKQIGYYQDYISFCKDLPINNIEVGFGSRKMTFPLQINELKLIDSSTNLAIQCADLVASAIAFIYNNKQIKQHPFVEEIKNSRLLYLENFHTIWPTTKFSPEELDMKDPSGLNVLDFLATMKYNEGI